MRVPLQIAFHGVDHSDGIEANVRQSVERLDRLCHQIMGCRVAVEAQHHGGAGHRPPVHIRIDLTLPRTELVVTSEPMNGHSHDVEIGVRQAFATMERRLRDHMEKRRG